MNDTGIRPEVIEEIRNLAQKYDIEKVILFGSRARGDFRRTSDIDIAVTGGDFASSPKIILKTAYKAGMIRDEEQWLRALQARNNVTYSYNRKIASGIIADAKEEFYQMFCELKTEIEQNWL